MGGASMSASLLGLKAELERSKASASTPRSRSSASKPLKLPSVAGQAGSSSWQDDEVSHDAVRQSLERKARTYAQLSAGKYAGVSDTALRESSIDWTRKLAHSPSRSESPPPAPQQDDPMVEYVDEFGRTRISHLSEIPRDLLPQHDDDEEEQGENVMYGPAQSFPVYTPAPRVPENKFDAAEELRYRGAAFYRFSTDKDERERQMKQLHQQHAHTQAVRSTTKREQGLTPLKQRLAERAGRVHAERLRLLGPEALEQRTRRIHQARFAALLPP